MNISPLVVIVRDLRSPLSARLGSFVDALTQTGGLDRLFETERLIVAGQRTAPHLVLPDGAGLIWGRLFERMTSWRITDEEGLRNANAPFEQFIERHWGGYLAIREIGGIVEILRDPSGAIPCYHARLGDARIFTTRISLLTDSGLIQSEIDWTIVTQSLIFQDLRPTRTALRGVDELMPGTSARFAPHRTEIDTVWTPWRFAAQENEIGSLNEAVERVRRATMSCVTAWGQCFERPLLELSGGLDSSIVAAVLAKANPNTHCVTFAAIEGDPDETPYARTAAEALGLTLEVLQPDTALVDVARSSARDLPRPSARAFSQAHDAGLRAIAERQGSDAFFSGGGGDNVFAYLRSALPVIDRWKRGSGGVLTTIGEIAQVTDVSFWKVIVTSVQRGLRFRAAHRWLIRDRFISAPALRDLPYPHGHPWIDAPATILPGKRVHGLGLIVIQNHLEGFERLQDAPIVSPLLSQPLIEVCMAVPTWLWCAGGENRAVARKAFANVLPPVVIERRSKGAFDTYSSRVFEANRGAIREMLLGGALARRALIDTAQVEAVLSRDTVSKIDVVRLLDLVDVEAWADAWASRTIGSTLA